MKTILLTSAGMNMKDEIVKILPKPAGEVGFLRNKKALCDFLRGAFLNVVVHG